ncbi:unnamed protein product [Anisakis simplex]|uniref:Uncharacterized protein n=1 Tax=Anisakis simplex TaxID=6269 RepID=A0A3P6R199_ANISI|nr:unnamed protein product [Anisakis simplex]
MISIYLSGIYTAFQCFENWRTNYITVALGLFAFVLYIPSRSGIMDSKLFGTRVGYLHLTYMCVALFGMLPTVHWFSLHGGFENPHVVSWLPNIFILYTLIGFAFIFYVTMIPERLVPGKFDVLGCSHQWWHLFILIAMIFWQSRGIQFLSVVRSMPKFCSDVATVRNLTSSTTFNLTTPQHEFSVY